LAPWISTPSKPASIAFSAAWRQSSTSGAISSLRSARGTSQGTGAASVISSPPGLLRCR
jgi:hypothetical protein